MGTPGFNDALNDRLGTIAAIASEGKEALPELIAAMDDKDAAIRYWGATGIGNIGADAAILGGHVSDHDYANHHGHVRWLMGPVDTIEHASDYGT